MVEVKTTQWDPHIAGTGSTDEYGIYPEKMCHPDRIARLRTHPVGTPPQSPRPVPLSPSELDAIAGWAEGTTEALERGDMMVSVARYESLWHRLYREALTRAGCWMEVDGFLSGWNGPAVAGAIRALAARHGVSPEELCWQAGVVARMSALLSGREHRVDVATLHRLARAAGEFLPE